MISSSKKLQDNYKELEQSEHRILNIVHNNHKLITNINKSLSSLEGNIKSTFSGLTTLRGSNSLLLTRLKTIKALSSTASSSQNAKNESSESFKNIKLFLIEGITFESIQKDFLSSEFIKAMCDIDTVLTNLSCHQEKVIFPFFQESFRICITLVSIISNRLTPFLLLEIDQLEVLTCNTTFSYLNDYKQHMAFLEKYKPDAFNHILSLYNKRKTNLIQGYLQEVNHLLMDSNKHIKSDLGYLDEIINDNNLGLFLLNARIQTKISGSFELTTSTITMNKKGQNRSVDESDVNTLYRSYLDLIDKWNTIETPSSFIFILESKNFTPTDKNYVFLYSSLIYDIIKMNKEFQLFESSFFNNTRCMSSCYTIDYKINKESNKSLLNRLNKLNPFGANNNNSNTEAKTSTKGTSYNSIYTKQNVNGLSEYNNSIYNFLKHEIEKIENIFLLVSISFNLDRITFKNKSIINSNQTQILFEKLSIDLLCRVKDKLNELPLILTKKSKITSFLFSRTNTTFKDIEYNIYLLRIFSSYLHSYNNVPLKDFPNLILYRNLIQSNINILVNNTDELIKLVSLNVNKMDDKMLYLIITNLIVYEFNKALIIKEQNDYIIKIYRNKLVELLKDYFMLLINELKTNKETEQWCYVRWKNIVIDYVKKMFSKIGEYCVNNKINFGNGVRIYLTEYIMDSFVEEIVKGFGYNGNDNKEDYRKKLKEVKCEEINGLIRVYKTGK